MTRNKTSEEINIGGGVAHDERVALGRFSVAHKRGLHLRTAARVALAVSQFSCVVTLTYGNVNVNAKSVMDILTLQAQHGAIIEVVVEGAGARACSEAIGEVIGAADRSWME